MLLALFNLCFIAPLLLIVAALTVNGRYTDKLLAGIGEPEWWGEFESQFRAYVRAHERTRGGGRTQPLPREPRRD